MQMKQHIKIALHSDFAYDRAQDMIDFVEMALVSHQKTT
jgi:hypothetical protein